jgi:hypothetical protein
MSNENLSVEQELVSYLRELTFRKLLRKTAVRGVSLLTFPQPDSKSALSRDTFCAVVLRTYYNNPLNRWIG